MTSPLTCAEISERSLLVERYCAGTIPADEVEALEVHYLGCDRCQQAVRLAAAVRQGLASQTPRRSADHVRRIAVAGSLAIAAGIAAVAVLPRGRAPTAVVALGRVTDPPIYLGVPVRASVDRTDSLFDAAMTAYAAGRHADAAAGLRTALASGADTAAGAFFLGASLLLLDRPREAVESLELVIGRGDTPYTDEARYYRAKALLRIGRPADALADLRRVARDADVIAGAARALADSVERVR